MRSVNPPLPASGLGIYVHFPWCLKKCPYCDFLSVAVPGDEPGVPLGAEAARKRIPHGRYADAVIEELRARVKHLPSPLPEIRSIFFGGGTPSLWEPEEVGRVLDEIKGTFKVASAPASLEVTLECNPTSFSEAHARALISVGVNRTSLGVQALEEERLQFLGRLHDASGGLQAIRDALAAGVPRVSADLIYGVYKQGSDRAVSDVEQVISTGISHLSAYALTIEPGTRFGTLAAKGKLPLLEEAQVATSFERVAQAAQAAGFRHYEISNFARPGHESQHNLGYWLGRDYLGLGTGAYGTVTLGGGRLRYRNLLVPERYLDVYSSPSITGDVFSEHLTDREEITPEIAHQEALLLGLRTEMGVNLEEITLLRGVDKDAEARAPILARLLDQGRLVNESGRWAIAKKHWLFADAIIRDLI